MWFPDGAEWVADLEAELLSFPRGRHDDRVDAVSYLCTLAGRYDRSKPEVEPDADELARRKEEDAQRRHIAILTAGLSF